jgi:hypothetical protein
MRARLSWGPRWRVDHGYLGPVLQEQRGVSAVGADAPELEWEPRATHSLLVADGEGDDVSVRRRLEGAHLVVRVKRCELLRVAAVGIDSPDLSIVQEHEMCSIWRPVERRAIRYQDVVMTPVGPDGVDAAPIFVRDLVERAPVRAGSAEELVPLRAVPPRDDDRRPGAESDQLAVR